MIKTDYEVFRLCETEMGADTFSAFYTKTGLSGCELYSEVLGQTVEMIYPDHSGDVCLLKLDA